MKGIALCEKYWEEFGRPALLSACPSLMDYAAAGLAGEGSDCFGYDDEISRDHDWGPGFCLWLSDEGMARFSEEARRVYAALPAEFLGYERLNMTAQTAGRVGVQGTRGFLLRYLGIDHVPQSVYEWRCVPEEGLATVTNGRIFEDGCGELSAIRSALLGYYPEELRLKKLAAQCALAAQAGQYNYYRCRRRGEGVAAMLALAKFTEHIQAVVFLLNRSYRPYYKWTNRRMRELPILGAEAASMLEGLTLGSGGKEEKIERLSAMIIEELRREGLSGSGSDFLLHHAEQIQAAITDEKLRRLHIMAE